MKLVNHYTNFVFPFVYEGPSRPKAIRRLLRAGRWGPQLFDVTPRERLLPAKTADERRTEYFLAYVRRYLFPTTACSRAEIDNLWNLFHLKLFDQLAYALDAFPVLYFKFNLLTLGAGENGESESLFRCIRQGRDLATGHLTQVGLQLLEHNIGLLWLKAELSADGGELTLQQLMDFNYEARSVEAFFGEHHTVTLSIGGRSWTPITLINHFLLELDETKTLADAQRDLRHSVQNERLQGLQEFYDDRTVVYSFACVSKEDPWDHPANADLREGFLALRRSDGTDRLESGYTEEVGRQLRLSRWMYSRFSFGKEGGCFVGSDEYATNLTVQPRYFDEYYFDIFRFAFYQRLVLLHISSRLAAVRALPRNTREVERIREQVLEFGNRCWFSQVTTRQQGQEIFDRWQTALAVRPLFAEVQEKIREIDDALAVRATSKRDRLLVIVTVLFLPVTVVAGILGMNVEDFGAGKLTLKKVWATAVWLLVGFPVLVLVIAFWDSLISRATEARQNAGLSWRRWRTKVAAELSRN